MAFNSFLKIDGIEGESQQKGHEREIEVASFSWGETSSGNPAKGGGAGTGKVQMQDFHFTMNTSKASPVLLKSCASGEHIKEATLALRRTGANQQDYIVIKFTDVLVSQYGIAGSDGDDSPLDEISLAFVKIDFLFRQQNDDGSFG